MKMVRTSLGLILAASTACAATAPVLSRPHSSHAGIGAMGERTHFEQTQLTAPDHSSRGTPTRAETRRKNLFWTGLALAGIGTVSFIGFGIGGRIVQKQIDDGYDDGSLTRSEEDKLANRGELMNGIAIGAAVVGVAGIILASVTYGIDRSQCGQLGPKRECGPTDVTPAPAEMESAEAKSPEAEPADASAQPSPPAAAAMAQ
jgi:hypothetical protein